MSLAPSESYNLCWGDFQRNLCQSLSELRENEDFLDVTLILEDGDRFLRAHKLILSASSSYFRNVLKKNVEGGNCVLCMPPETRFEDLSSLLEFIYLGEVSVNQDDIESFMALAKVLKIKGLTQDNESLKAPAPIPGTPSKERFTAPRPFTKKRARYEEEGNRETQVQGSNTYYEGPREECYETKQMNLSLSSGTKLMGLICPGCRNLFGAVQALKDHMAHDCPASAASLHPANEPESGEYQQVICNICDKTFKSQKNMLAHQKRQHKMGGTDESGGMAMTLGMMAKKRGRPSKKSQPPPLMNEEEDDEESEYADSVTSQAGVMMPHGSKILVEPTVRPVVPVPPAPRPPHDIGKVQEDHSRQSSPIGEGIAGSPMHPRALPHSMGAPRGPQRSSTPNTFRKNQQHPQVRGRPSSRNMDLKKIGLKLGGQISITSSENDHPVGSPSGSLPNGNKLTITKLKGDHPIGSPLSIKEATGRRSQNEHSQSSIEVKEEPTDYGDNNGEDPGYANDRYGATQGNYVEMDGTSTARLEGDRVYEGYENNTDEDVEDRREYIPTSHLIRRYANSSQNPSNASYAVKENK